MGSDTGVDGNIHRAIDSLANQKGFFKETMIRERLDGNGKKAYNTIRCQRGQAVTTSGYGLCDYVIHVVGIEFDGRSRKESRWNYKTCSFSRVQTLESCYYAIVEWKQKDPEMFCARIAYMQKTIQKYGAKFRQDKKVIFQTSWQSNFQVMQDVRKYDERRGILPGI